MLKVVVEGGGGGNVGPTDAIGPVGQVDSYKRKRDQARFEAQGPQLAHAGEKLWTIKLSEVRGARRARVYSGCNT